MLGFLPIALAPILPVGSSSKFSPAVHGRSLRRSKPKNSYDGSLNYFRHMILEDNANEEERCHSREGSATEGS